MISQEFQEMILLVVAPIAYDLVYLLIALSLLVAVSMPLFNIGLLIRRLGDKGM